MGEEIWEQFSGETEQIEARIEEVKRDRAKLEVKVQSSINKTFESAEREFKEFTRKIEGKIKLEENEIKRIAGEQTNIEESTLEEFRREIKDHSPELSARIKNLLEVQRMASDFEDAKCEEASYKRTREFFNKGTWKSR